MIPCTPPPLPAFITPKTPMFILWTSLPLSVEGAKGLVADDGAAAAGGGGGATLAGLAMAWNDDAPKEGSTGLGPCVREVVWNDLTEDTAGAAGKGGSTRWWGGTDSPTMGRRKLGGSPQTLSCTFFPIIAMRALRQRRHSSAVSVMQGLPGRVGRQMRMSKWSQD